VQHLFAGYFGGTPMKTVIFHTENAAFKFDQKKVKDHLIRRKLEYAPDEVSQLLELISNDGDKTILNPDGHSYFGHVAVNLIGSGIGIVTCKICDKIYKAGQPKEFGLGHGKSPFDIKQKGGIRLFEKRKNPSMFGGQGYKCPAGHELISMETWKT
jgi:hypothetical protein